MNIGDLIPERSADDMRDRIVRVQLGDADGAAPVEYVLPVKAMRDNRAWKSRLGAEVVRTFASVDDAGDDLGAVFDALDVAPEPFLDMLLLYDTAGQLPPRAEILANTTEIGLVIACLEVWRAASPLVDIGLGIARMVERSASDMATSSNSWRGSTGGQTPMSRVN